MVDLVLKDRDFIVLYDEIKAGSGILKHQLVRIRLLNLGRVDVQRLH